MHVELDGVYQPLIKNWGMSMYGYMKSYGFAYDSMGEEAISDNLRTMKGQLRGYMLQLDPEAENTQFSILSKPKEDNLNMNAAQKKLLSDYAKIKSFSSGNLAINVQGVDYPVLKDTLEYLESNGYIRKLEFDSGDNSCYFKTSAFDAFTEHLLAQTMEEETMPRAFDNKKVFIVHGHDHALLNEVELMIHRIGLHPVILMNQANAGDTIIEKIEHHTDVGFGIVLYTACDEGRVKNSKTFHDRARQNVVFEHGYLCAKLGRNRVAAINDDNIEIPSDLSGVLYIPRTASDWKNQLFREMRAAGLDFDPTRA